MRTYVKTQSQKVLGYYETDSQGNKTVYTQHGSIVSRYNKSTDTTTDFVGRIVTFGDTATGALLLLPGANVKF